MTQTDINVVKETCVGFMDFMVYMIERVDVGTTAIPRALAAIRRAREHATPMFEAFSEVYGELGKQFEILGQLARAAVNQQAASNIANVAAGMDGGGRRRRHRGLRESVAQASAFKPLYSMAYAGLGRLFMQYKLQNAAFQFCEFYEYKNGGIAPTMCGSAGKFYTPADIQAMRAYAAPTLRQFTVYALLPTRATPASGDTSASLVARPRPYLDLDRLAKGETASFTLPVNDLDWLKAYSWAFPSDTDASLAGMYVQSMQVFLPYTTKPNATTAATQKRLDVLTTVNVGAAQWLNAQNNKTFVFPKKTMVFSTAVNAPVCAAKIVNPYHEAASCVRTDGSSSLCVYDDGSLLSTDLLPSLFSTWQISTSKKTASDAFTLALPGLKRTDATTNTTSGAADGVDLNVLVLLKVVRVTRPTITTLAAANAFTSTAATDTCCASDEFYASGECTACPVGSTGALNGYSCQRLE